MCGLLKSYTWRGGRRLRRRDPVVVVVGYMTGAEPPPVTLGAPVCRVGAMRAHSPAQRRTRNHNRRSAALQPGGVVGPVPAAGGVALAIRCVYARSRASAAA